MKRKTNEKLVSALYDEKSGLMQRTLKNGNTVSVLFGGLGYLKQGKKGNYVALPKNLTGVTLPMSLNDGNDTYSGLIKIGNYNKEKGMYSAKFSIGRSSITKDIKVHDLATLWCVVSTSADVLSKELARIEKKSKKKVVAA